MDVLLFEPGKYPRSVSVDTLEDMQLPGSPYQVQILTGQFSNPATTNIISAETRWEKAIMKVVSMQTLNVN